MTMYSSAWARPIQGISQQPPRVRLAGQCSNQINAIASAQDGLYTRPGTNYVAAMEDAAFPEGTQFYFYNRGTDEAYFIVITPNAQPQVYDRDGDRLVVEGTSSYAATNYPATDLRLSTISDFTFIANRQVAPQASSTNTTQQSNTAIVSVQFADYGKTYTISLDGVDRASYTTPDGSQSEHINFVDTSYVATKLLLQLVGSDPFEDDPANETHDIREDGYGVSRDYNTIYLTNSDFTVDTEDGRNGEDLIAVQGAVSSVDKLPTRAPDGYLLEVVGTGSGNSEVFWLKASGTSGSTVTWTESIAPGISAGLDPSTMPHALVRDRFEGGKAVFKYQSIDWDEREVGDDDTNPQPSFVQDAVPITSVGTFQNRLYFTAGESVVYSQSNAFFNFYRSTIRTAKDDEPIDVYADTNQVNTLESSASLDGDLVFFSANGQFLQAGDDPVTKANATLQYASSFEANTQAIPVAAGDAIFFAFDYGRYSGIREFYTDSFTDTKRARPVTDHVDELILGKVHQMATTTSRNQLMILADAPNRAYLYTWLWQGQERVQSSWGVWDFGGEVRYVRYDKDRLYFIIDRDGASYLERIDTGEPDDVGLDFSVRLDNRFEAQATWEQGRWYFEAPYEGDFTFVRASGCLDAGVTVDATYANGRYSTSERLSDGTDPVTVIGGLRYEFLYEPTMPFMKDAKGRVISEDRLIISDVRVNYDSTGLTNITVTNDVGAERNYSFNGRRIGGPFNLVGFAPLKPGEYTFPIRQDSDRATFTLRSDSHLPFKLRDMEWRGRYKQRGRRV